jgi:hypothetical protein
VLVLESDAIVSFVDLCNEGRQSGGFDRGPNFELAVEQVSLELLVKVISIRLCGGVGGERC